MKTTSVEQTITFGKTVTVISTTEIVTDPSDELGTNGRVIEQPLRDLLTRIHSPDLTNLSRAELDRCLLPVIIQIKSAIERDASVPDNIRVAFWYINQEFTRRGIPPSLRNLPDPHDDDPEQIADRVAIDLAWLVAHYPKHEAAFRRWKHLWRPKSFHSQSDFISLSYPRRDFWWFVKGLNLDPDQQLEMHFLRKASIARKFEQTAKEQARVRIQLATAYHERAKDPRYRSENPSETINRRLLVWYLTSLFGWASPSKIANLYTAITGGRVERHLIAKLIAQVCRDVPEVRKAINEGRGRQ